MQDMARQGDIQVFFVSIELILSFFFFQVNVRRKWLLSEGGGASWTMRTSGSECEAQVICRIGEVRGTSWMMTSPY